MTDYMGYLKAYLQGFQSGYLNALSTIEEEQQAQQQAAQTTPKRAKPKSYARSPEGEKNRIAAVRRYWATHKTRKK